MATRETKTAEKAMVAQIKDRSQSMMPATQRTYATNRPSKFSKLSPGKTSRSFFPPEISVQDDLVDISAEM